MRHPEGGTPSIGSVRLRRLAHRAPYESSGIVDRRARCGFVRSVQQLPVERAGAWFVAGVAGGTGGARKAVESPGVQGERVPVRKERFDRLPLRQEKIPEELVGRE